MKKQPSEKTRLKHEARYLKQQIRQAQALIKQRGEVECLRDKLEFLLKQTQD